ncbi:3-oxoacyl-[acyl-carrier-protein] reductase FabG [compost metagenome]
MATRKALVTGASGGIGRVFAQRLAKDGYRVTAVARTEARLQELVAELGGECRYLVADLSTPEGMARVAEDIGTESYDLLVNNAGVGVYGAFDDMSLEEHRALIRLNCEAPMALAYAFLGKAKRGDALINVASMLGFFGLPTLSVYSATKAFVRSFTETLWFEQKARGVYVMALCPGPTSSNFHDASRGTAGNRPSAAISQTPEQVVDEAMKALAARRKPTVLTGSSARTLVSVTNRFLSLKQAVMMMGRMTKNY